MKLKSGAKLKGYITKTEEESFDLTNYQIRQTVAVPYRDVAQVKSQNGSSKSMKTTLTVAGVAAVVVLVLTLPREDSAICPLGCRSF